MQKEFCWQAKPTGDMTLSVINEKNERILTVNMLTYKTMKAETNGDVLARTLNDLTLISKIPSILNGEFDVNQLSGTIPYPDAGISPLPWSVSYLSDKNYIEIKDCLNKKIAERKYSSKMNENYINQIVSLLSEGTKVVSEYLEEKAL